VLMYHRISRESDYLGLSVSPNNFERQLSILHQTARIVPLGHLVERLDSSEPLDEDIASITFDDGYRDNLDIALPILKRFEASATVFVTTNFVEGSQSPFGERMRCAFESLWRHAVKPNSWKGIGENYTDKLVRLALARPGSLKLIRTLVFSVPRMQWKLCEDLLAELEQRAGLSSVSASSTMLDWSGVRELARNGIEIGSHTLSHPILAGVPMERAENEIIESKRLIESNLGQEVRGFAFPVGGANDFTQSHIECLRNAGYSYACTGIRGVNLACASSYHLRRIGVGNYANPMFDLKLAIGK